MNIKQQIEKTLGHPISVSTIDICDYQCNACFAIAKEQKVHPMQIASEMASKFKSPLATTEAVAPGFVNFKITDGALESAVNEILKTGKLPLEKQTPRKIFFDYGGANVAKELHVGHLRPPIIGEALKRVFKALGHETISDTHLGDWGLQIGLVLAQLEDEENNDITLEKLNELYPKASKRKDTDTAFYNRAEQITAKLQQSKQPYFGLWKKIISVSVPRIQENYKTLNCTFDTFEGEYKAQQYVDEILTLLKDVTYKSENCIVMDVKTDSDTRPMPPILLRKSNGGELYSTTDVATIHYRQKEYNPDEYIYVVDFRQELHLEQVFRCVKKGNLVPPETRLVHVSYGTMNGADGKPFKTRTGGTIKFEEVINLITECASKRLSENGRSVDIETAQKIGIAALKFADLSNNVRKDYVFDIEKFTSFEGKTGPYLLYTVARINSVLNKANNTPIPNNLTVSKTNRDVIIKTIKLADSYASAAANYTLNGLVDAVYNLAVAFNLFYAGESIIKGGHLPLARLVKTAMLFALDTLAITVVQEM